MFEHAGSVNSLMRHRMDIERMSKINPSSMSMRQSASRVWTEQGLAFDLFAAGISVLLHRAIGPKHQCLQYRF